jgi:enoyl-CoA hydratase
MSEFDEIAYERRGAGAYVELRRPERRNALTMRMVGELEAALDAAEGDEDVRAIAISGAGGHFCAGADLDEVIGAMQTDGAGEDMALLRPLLALLVRLREVPKPVIAAVDGVCAAGGLELLLCCDLVIATERARISDAHARHGLLPGMGGAAGLVRSVGPFRAKELLFLAEFRSARDLAAIGLVNRVVPDADLAAAIEALVGELATRSPSGLRRMKAMANQAFDVPWPDAARSEFAQLEHAWRSPDLREGVAAFVERRAPVFGPLPR